MLSRLALGLFCHVRATSLADNLSGLNFENSQSPSEHIEPKNAVNSSATKKPMNGDAMRPATPVRGRPFHCTVEAPNSDRIPMSKLNGTKDNTLPIASSLNS